MDQPRNNTRGGADADPPPAVMPPPARHAAERHGVRMGWGIALFLCGMAAGALGLYFGVQRHEVDNLRTYAGALDHDLAETRGRLDQTAKTLAALEGRLFIEESTRRGLETTLRTLQDELGQAKDTIAFYEQLMPPGPKGAVSVRALDIERAGPHLKYRVLLMRSGSNDQAFRGELQFVATGKLDGQDTTVTLRPATLPASRDIATADSDTASTPDETGVDELALQFDEFQRSGGLLGVPDGFVPETVKLNVLEGKTLRVSRSVELAEH